MSDGKFTLFSVPKYKPVDSVSTKRGRSVFIELNFPPIFR